MPNNSLYGQRGWDKAPPPQQRQPRGTRRFWIPAPKNGERTEVQVCLTDGQPFFLTEHNYKLGGNWRNWATCIQNMSEKGCPLCKAAAANSNLPINTYDAAALTLVNMTGYTNRESGDKVQNYRELLVIKGDSITKFKNWNDRKNGLRGCIYVVTRTGNKKESIGDDWDFQEKIDEDNLKTKFNDNAAPLDYADILPMKSFDELSSIARQIEGTEPVNTGASDPSSPGTSSGGSGGSGGSIEDDSIPF